MALLFLKCILWVAAIMLALSFISSILYNLIFLFMPQDFRDKEMDKSIKVRFIPAILAAILFYIISKLP